MIDVLIIAYNHAPYLHLAIESVLAQDCQDDINRIIICDDASTDGSRAVIEELVARCPEKIVPILRDENVGLARNFRLGLAYCHAPYVAILEGDDLWCARGKLSAQKHTLDHYPSLVAVAHDVIGIAHSEISMTDLDHTKLNGNEELVELNNRALMLHNQYGFLPSTVLARTTLLKQCALPEFDDLKTLDCAVHWLLAQKGELGFFHVPMMIHGSHSDSAFSKPNNLLTVYLIQVLLRLLPHLSDDYSAIATAWLHYYSQGWLKQLKNPGRYAEIPLSYRYISECGDAQLSEYFFGENGLVAQHEQSMDNNEEENLLKSQLEDLRFRKVENMN
ncbi:MAG: glycosyltransferase family A protein [Alphaproteobacteria bacterium]|nr:glycosyltransferase family A protein [Alphaproteobacteria bacterium]